jgi:peroxiredoxin (alkyl hydroperoxide reductase subunit C)
MVQVGDIAPEFNLRSNDRDTVSLASFRGNKNVVLAFYVLAFTGG